MDIKNSVDAILREAGTTPGEVMRGVWHTIAHTGQLPRTVQEEEERARKRRVLQELRELCESMPPCPELVSLTKEDMREMFRSRNV